MIRNFVKLLPYWLVMRICRSINGSYGKLNTGGKDYDVRYFQISEGEIVTFAPELQKIFDERRKEKVESKREKKKNKLWKKVSKDYSTKTSIKEKFEEEEKEEKERRECGFE